MDKEYSIIKTEGLEKLYGKGAVKTHALKGVDIEIPTGAFTCITGPSGHGKSTLLNLIGGLDKPTAGKVFIGGVDITGLSNGKLAAIRASKIGFVFQFFNLLQNLTALENIQTAMMLNPAIKLTSKAQKEKAAELLELVGLLNKADAKPYELSGGQQQRVSIARALANNPDILLMDEPTGNLDTESEKEVLEHIFAVHKTGKTVIIVTHNDSLAKKAELLLEIRDGRCLNYTP
ncbi:MAG: ABC transporter ATP-binding protein [Oscillospiraceae bacterium]|nr:ABC transporter ATP-binding protein [Oscillospiraceae bacterium]